MRFLNKLASGIALWAVVFLVLKIVGIIDWGWFLIALSPIGGCIVVLIFYWILIRYVLSKIS